MGSSIVMMWLSRVALMVSSIEASVVVFPEPVGPVTRMRPRGVSRSERTAGGRPISSRDIMRFGMMRSARAMLPCWR